MKMKTFDIIFIVGLTIMVMELFFAIGGYIDGEIKGTHTIIVDCFDKYGNEIIGVDCYDEVSNSDYNNFVGDIFHYFLIINLLLITMIMVNGVFYLFED